MNNILDEAISTGSWTHIFSNPRDKPFAKGGSSYNSLEDICNIHNIALSYFSFLYEISFPLHLSFS